MASIGRNYFFRRVGQRSAVPAAVLLGNQCPSSSSGSGSGATSRFLGKHMPFIRRGVRSVVPSAVMPSGICDQNGRPIAGQDYLFKRVGYRGGKPAAVMVCPVCGSGSGSGDGGCVNITCCNWLCCPGNTGMNSFTGPRNLTFSVSNPCVGADKSLPVAYDLCYSSPGPEEGGVDCCWRGGTAITYGGGDSYSPGRYSCVDCVDPFVTSLWTKQSITADIVFLNSYAGGSGSGSGCRHGGCMVLVRGTWSGATGQLVFIVILDIVSCSPFYASGSCQVFCSNDSAGYLAAACDGYAITDCNNCVGTTLLATLVE